MTLQLKHKHIEKQRAAAPNTVLSAQKPALESKYGQFKLV